jgi:hypothetical protein
MTDDLVKRLRERYFRKGYETETEAKERRQKEREEAADRIEQLEQRLEATKDKAEAAILDLMADRDRAEARVEVLVREAILDAKLLADTQALLDKAVVALRDCADLLDGLVAESGRSIEWGEEDPFRMGEWFEPEDLAKIERARAALAEIEGHEQR